MSSFRCASLALLLSLGPVFASFALDLPSGLSVDPPKAYELTYQVVPTFDEKDKVLAGWDGEKLQYFVTSDKLPPGWTNAQAYFVNFVRDLKASGSTVKTGQRGDYTTAAGWSGSYLLVDQRPDAASPSVPLVAHFLTDGKASYVAFATVVDPAKSAVAVEQTVAIFKTATVTEQAAAAVALPVERKEAAFVGVWRADETMADGRKLKVDLQLKAGLTFLSTIVIDGQQVFTGAGAWSVKGNKILWAYNSSQPSLPMQNREDEDEIVSVEADRFVSRAATDGKEHVYLRVK